MLKFRVIKKDNCHICKNYLRTLDLQKVDYVLYDADAAENQQQLDDWKVDILPVVQIIDQKEDGSVAMLHQFRAGRIIIRELNTKMAELKKKADK